MEDSRESSKSTENEDFDFEKELDSYIEHEERSKEEAKVIFFLSVFRFVCIDLSSVLYCSKSVCIIYL